MMKTLCVLLILVAADGAVIHESDPAGPVRIMQDGPKVSIKSVGVNRALALHGTDSRKRMSDLHEIFLTPYRYIEKDMRAVVNLVETERSSVRGTIFLKQATPEGSLTVKGTVEGLSPGQKHGIHVHEFGDVRNGCRTDRIGSHYNPYKFSHGAPNTRQRHAGDLGNIVADMNGRADFLLTDKQLSLVGARSIIGRSIVIDQREDDFSPADLVALPAACGVIGRVD